MDRKGENGFGEPDGCGQIIGGVPEALVDRLLRNGPRVVDRRADALAREVLL